MKLTYTSQLEIAKENQKERNIAEKSETKKVKESTI